MVSTQSFDWIKDKSVLITGGTGSFGKEVIRFFLGHCPPKRLVIFSRDEFKQHEMRTSGLDHPCMRYFIGDVRDRDRLCRALDGIEIVVHAAAMKQVPACEYNPLEAIKTNVLGAANLIDAAIDRNVEKIIALSTDKAANPVNLYGATKLCSDKLFIAANSYSGTHKTRFSVVRYGNVIGSRGSVVPLFKKLRSTGTLPVTDENMTRFWIKLTDGVQFVLSCLGMMEGGEIFVPKVKSMRIIDLAKAVAPECSTRTIGIRPGEKLHEVLVPEDDARTTVEYDDYFVILPAFRPHICEQYAGRNGGRTCLPGFCYASNTNDQWLEIEELRRLIGSDGE
jgi:UDP-N-acetylglucosamine 4,6-dehydratase/5-epimerase